MRMIQAETEIAAPVLAVWPLIARFEHWPKWGPTVRAVSSDASEVALGVSGRVQTPLGLWLPFEITSVEVPRYWDWAIAGVGATGHRLFPIDEARCRVVFTAPIWAAPYRLVLSSGLRRIKRLAETSRS